MKKILIVDDEIQILNSLTRMFSETDYEIITADGSMEVLKLLEHTEIDMVISDMRMPEMDGYELLSIIKKKYPKVIRIILSGYADEKPMFRALLHNVAKLYVFKPWNNNDFLQNIRRLFEDENELNSSTLKKKLEEVNYASIISTNCQKMIDHIEEEDIDKLICSIEQDPEISKLLLQVAKTAVYGAMPDKVKQAAIYIGLHNLKSFMHFACVLNNQKPEDKDLNELDTLTRHSFLTNRIFLFLFEAFLHKQPTESAMFAGLMHNIGLIILMNASQENSDKAELSVDDYVKLEHGADEVIHQEIGAHFIDQWDLPFPIYEAALYHHRPLDNNIIHLELVSCVHIAQAYAWKTMGAKIESIAPEVFDNIDATVEDFEKRLARYLK